MITRGTSVHEPMVNFLGHIANFFVFLQIPQNIDGFRQDISIFKKLLELIKLYRQKPLERFI